MEDLGFAIGRFAAVLCGDALSMLPQVPEKSVQTCVTSPPYWGLRDYGIEPLVWGGDEEWIWHSAGAHEWTEHVQPAANGLVNNTMQGETLSGQSATRKPKRSDFCECGAWRGQLGLEPTPELYVEHIVQVFRAVRRVLRDDGTLWLNLGDCYATGAGKVGDCPGGGKQGARWAGRDDSKGRGTPKRADGTGGHTYIGPMTQPNRMPIAGLKPKDLVGIPWRVAFALQADGWYLRSDIIWSKPNPMPESVTDRPTKAHEYLFLLSKSERYYYDAEAIAERSVDPESLRPEGRNPRGQDAFTQRDADTFARTRVGFSKLAGVCYPTRNKRSVWTVVTQPFTGWTKTSRQVRVEADAPCDGKTRIESPDCPVHGDRVVHVSSASYDEREAGGSSRNGHIDGRPVQERVSDSAPTDLLPSLDFAPQSSDWQPPSNAQTAKRRSNRKSKTDPALLTSPPYNASVQIAGDTGSKSESREFFDSGPSTPESNSAAGAFRDDADLSPSVEILCDNSGKCTCEYYITETDEMSHFATFPPELIEPCILAGCPEGGVVLDPFAGSGTAGVVALRHGREFIGIELKPEYCEMARNRITQDAPLFNSMPTGAPEQIPKAENVAPNDSYNLK